MIWQVVIKCFPWWNILLYNISNNNDYFHESFQRWRVALLILTALVCTQVPLKPTTTAGVPVMRWWSQGSFRKSRQCCPVYHPQQRPHRLTRLCSGFLVSFCQFQFFWFYNTIFLNIIFLLWLGKQFILSCTYKQEFLQYDNIKIQSTNK